jgi:hypothetical protein
MLMLIPLVLGYAVASFPLLLALATITHLVTMHRYGWLWAVAGLALFSISTVLFVLQIGYPLLLALMIIAINAIASLVLMMPVKRHLHSVLVLGIGSGLALIYGFYLLMHNPHLHEAWQLFLEQWNSMVPQAHQYVSVQGMHTNFLYELALGGVAMMVKVVAFLWFMGRWIGLREQRVALVRNFTLSTTIHIFLAVSVLSYLAINAIIKWTALDITGQFIFVWSNLMLIALFLLCLDGLAVLLRWLDSKEWPEPRQERVIVIILLLITFPSYWVGVGTQALLSVIGLSFSRRLAVMQN